MSMVEERWFNHINRPSRYLGNEINTVRKNPTHTDLYIALAFPDLYEVGMSHFGLKILYQILNRHKWLAAERVFCPGIDLEKEMRRHKLPLATLETSRPLAQCDIVGFSLQHELSFTNVLNMLELSGIPLFASERSDNDPLIIAGGPACFNPEPVADFFDAMVIGDGEDVAVKICEAARKNKHKQGANKKAVLSQICRIRGVYVPSYFKVRYSDDQRIQNIEPLFGHYRIVEKAIVPNIDDYPFPERQIVPFTELVHDRLSVEIFRGCTRGCRFCQAGMIYRPVRERRPETVLKRVENSIRYTGYDDVSLLSLSSGDYGCLEPILKTLMDRMSNEKVSISLPSIRIDSFHPSLLDQVKRVRKTGFTFAPEAGNDRLRKYINKDLSNKDILEMASQIYAAGWNLIKLYFMIGLPTEGEKDLQDIVDLSKQIIGISGRRGKHAKLNLSISTFVPKSHTPFAWEPQISLEESKRRIQFIRKGIGDSAIRVKWNQPELSWLEGIFSRGDRRLGEVVLEAWRLGAKFDSWGEHFQLEIWEEAFRRIGIAPDFYLHRERPSDEIFPWDHISAGVKKSHLRNEFERAKQGELTPDCRKGCLDCGVCDKKTVAPVLYKDYNALKAQKDLQTKPFLNDPCRYRLSFTKLERARYLGHLEIVKVFLRAFRRANLKLVYTRGYHPLPKISFACALPLGTESLEETIDIELHKSMNPLRLRDRVNTELPPGIDVVKVERLPSDSKKAQLKESHFLIRLNGNKMKKRDLSRFMDSEYFPVSKLTKKKAHKINVRPLIRHAILMSPDTIKIIMQHSSGPEPKPGEIVRRIFSLNKYQLEEMKILKVHQVLQ